VEAVRAHIRRGNIYQANLTQRFASEGAADPFDLYRGMTVGAPAPRAAFVETGSLALASASPEIFLRSGSDGRIETWPIKGTRPRGGSAEEDAAHARALLASEKDRAELLMIVDLERNDLGRVSRTGSVRVRELAALRSYATVHHLVACVEGTLREDVSVSDIMRATFPGGSITGAPKERAIEILRELEPVSRNFYTGSLVWLGDDGRIDSSILIRSMTIAGGRALVGAGGGVVWDSDPEEEWLESCNKARAVLRVLGYEPEEAR
jgi:para-aminobenzoate synthetase component 1